MSTDDTYNGWTNWETWNTNLWMTNEQALLEEAQAIARQYIDEATDDPNDEDYTPRTVEAYGMGKALREWWEETLDPEEAGGAPLPGPIADAWSTVLGAVNWTEIAEGLAEE
jgi:hypothetical protein